MLVALSRTADDLKRRLNRVLEPSGLTLDLYNILWILRDAGPDGLPTLEIAERMVRRNPGVTRLLDRLIDKELVTRRRSDNDRRRVFCALTPEGLAVVEGNQAALLEAVDAMTSALDEEQLLVLGATLDRLRDRVNEDLI